MADSVDRIRQESPSASRSGSRKERPRSQAPELIAEHSSANAKKARRKSAIVLGDITADNNQSQKPFAKPKEGHEDILTEALLKAAKEIDEVREKVPPKEKSSSPKSPLIKSTRPAGPSKIGPVSESEGSSGSGETITQAPPPKRDSLPRSTNSKPKKYSMNKPDALSFLDSDSPQVTSDSTQRTVKESSKVSPDTAKSTSPSAQSASSGTSSYPDDLFDILGDQETDRSTSPERSVDGEPRGRQSGGAEPRMRTERYRKRSYGTPEMPHGNVQHPHIPPEDLTPRIPNQQFAKHLPRAEKLPLTGYELLASKLSATWPDHAGPQLRPMYRRFEALNHRLLLHLQDEICELEEQLHRLDAADTQNRRLQNCILPASRRAEYMSGGELQWHKTDILGKIGFKLEQYNRVLSSFRDTQYLLAPAPTEVQTYRNYLANYAPIADTETRFLDATEDLVCFGYNDEEDKSEDISEDEEDLATPLSRSDHAIFHNRRRASIFSQSDTSRRQDDKSIVSQDQDLILHKPSLTHVSVAVAGAVIVPILTFVVIPGFIGRMTVVCLVGIGTLGALVQGHVVELQATQETCLCLGLYGMVMAVLAGMIS